jgi:nucleotide-binding universal stress UspA family protein
MFNHILVATDGTALAREAERRGIELAAKLGSKLTFITVRMPFYVYTLEASGLAEMSGQYDEQSKASAQAILKRAGEAAAEANVTCSAIDVEDEYPYLAINNTATKHGCDLIVMASHGRRGVAALLLGSETVKVLTHATIPVLVCK